MPKRVPLSAFLLALGVTAAWLASDPARALSDSTPGATVSDESVEQTAAGPASFSPLVKAVKPAVVNISITGRVPARPRQGPHGGGPPADEMFPDFPEGSPFAEFFRRRFGAPRLPEAPERTFRAVGSGFIVDLAGLVVTNNHVIDRAEAIEVVLQDGSRYPATVRGRDEKTDLALLEVDAPEPLPYVALGSSAEVEVGDWVLAVGNPFGLGGTVTAGIVSARGRDLHAGPFDDFLQVDAPINRGNSGGPLFDTRGRVVGINTAIFSPTGGSVGIGFAIPSELARDVIGQLKEHGVVERGWLGIEFQPVTDAVADSLGLDAARGVLVADVVPDSPADRAGLKLGDVLLRFGNEDLDDARALPRLVAAAEAGDRVPLVVLRDGRERTLRVEIGRNEAAEAVARADAGGLDQQPQPGLDSELGLALAPITPEVRARFRLGDEPGVLVTDVRRGSPAARAGIRPGQIISMVGQTPVGSPDALLEALAAAEKAGRPSVLLMVSHRGARRFLTVELSA